MTNLHHILQRAQRRAFANLVLQRVGWMLTIAAVVAAVLVIVDRLTVAEFPPILFWMVLASGAIAGIVHAILTRPNRFEMAVQVDRHLHLKDRIATATTLPFQRNADPDFAALVQHDADRLASQLDLQRATPIRLTHIWSVAAPLVIAVIVAALYLPAMTFATSQRQTNTASPEQIAAAQQDAQNVVQEIQQTVAELPRDETLDEQTRAELEALEALASQLASDSRSPQEVAAARDESAARLNEIADRLAKQSERELAAADEIAQRFAGLDELSAPEAPMSAEALTEALSRGDFGEAAKQLQELEQRQDLTESDRREVAEHLREMSDAIDQSAAQQQAAESESQQQQREQIEQTLRDHGVDEQTAQEWLDNPPTQDEIERELQSRGLNEDIAQRLAEDVSQHQEQREIEEQADRDAQEINEWLRRAAEELQQENRNQQPSPNPMDQEPQPAGEEPAGNQRDELTDEVPSDQPRTSDPQQSAPNPQPQRPGSEPQTPQSPDGEQPKQVEQPKSPQQQPQSQPQQQPQQQPGQQSPQPGQPQQPQQPQTGDSQSQQQQPQQSPSAEQGGEQSQQQRQNQQQSATEDGAQGEQTPAATNPTSDQQPSDQQKDGAQQSPDAQTGEQQSDQQNQRQGEGAAKKPTSASEALRQLAERRQAARDQQQSSEKLREAARRMADRMTPEQREQWAREWQREMGENPPPDSQTRGTSGDPRGQPGASQPDPNQPTQPYQTEDLDLRGEETADRTLAQWLGEAQPGDQPTTSGTAAPRIRQAQEVAERAVNESAVQKRYHRMIQRYFGRLPQTVERATTEPVGTSE